MSRASDARLSLSPVSPRGKLAERVALQMLKELRVKGVAPGTRLPSERYLIASLEVGRSTIREAINGLAMLGVLEIRHGQGTFVADTSAGTARPSAIAAALSRGVTREFFEARRIVEVHVARLAAQRRRDADLEQMQEALSSHELALARGELAVEASVRFHVAIAAAARSNVLASFVTSLTETMTERGPALEAIAGYRGWELEQHRHVLEPIRDEDPDRAAARMSAHLEQVSAYHERLELP